MRILFWNIKKRGLELASKLASLSKDMDILIISELAPSKTSLKKSGKKSMSAKEFLNGNNLNVGEVID